MQGHSGVASSGFITVVPNRLASPGEPVLAAGHFQQKLKLLYMPSQSHASNIMPQAANGEQGTFWLVA